MSVNSGGHAALRGPTRQSGVLCESLRARCKRRAHAERAADAFLASTQTLAGPGREFSDPAAECHISAINAHIESGSQAPSEPRATSVA
jgi:hypothetical protein